MNSLRCDVCNYCRATDGPRRKVKVMYDPETRITLCTDCVKAIWPEPEQDKDTDIEPLAPRPLVEQRVLASPTLPKVRGVNDGPSLDVRMWSTDDEDTSAADSATEQDREVPSKETVTRDVRGTVLAEASLPGERKIFIEKG